MFFWRMPAASCGLVHGGSINIVDVQEPRRGTDSIYGLRRVFPSLGIRIRHVSCFVFYRYWKSQSPLAMFYDAPWKGGQMCSVNAGVLLWKNTDAARALAKKWWETPSHAFAFPREQGCLQGLIDSGVVTATTNPEVVADVYVIEECNNVHCSKEGSTPVFHLAASSNEDRKNLLKKAAKNTLSPARAVAREAKGDGEDIPCKIYNR